MNEEIMFENEQPVEETVVVDPVENIKISKFIGLSNICSYLDEDKLNCIYDQVNTGYQKDFETRKERNETLKEANKIAMQVVGNKTFPWENCANVKLPLITTGAIDFASKIYPAIIQDDEVVRCKVFNETENLDKMQTGERLSTYINYQLTEKMEDWKDDEDTLTYALPINGVMIKKVYFDVLNNQFKSDLVFPENFFTPNDTRDINIAERATHVYQMSTEDIISSARMKIFSGLDTETLLNNADGGVDNEIIREEDKITEGENRNVWTVCEQHCWLDLDKDGYREPYIVTFIPALEKVVRISARYDETTIKLNDKKQVIKITPIPYFVKYSFLPSPDGSFYSLGLGELLLPMNEAANTLTNQLLDAGTLNNLPAGWISKSAKISSGDMRLQPGEFKQINSFMGKVSDSIMLLPTKEPSAVSFELLKTLMASADEIASIKDLTNTDFPSNSSVITTLSIIENGMSPFKAIYKRFHTALSKEIKLLTYWMSKYVVMDEYASIVGNKGIPQDFEMISTIIPVSDPSLVTSTQKMGRAQFLADLRNDSAFDPKKVSIEMVKLMGVNPLPLLAEPPQPDPMAVRLQTAQVENIEAQTAEIYSRVDKNQVESQASAIRANSEDTKRNAEAIKILEEAENLRTGMQNQQHIQELKNVKDMTSEYVEKKTNVGKTAEKELPEQQ